MNLPEFNVTDISVMRPRVVASKEKKRNNPNLVRYEAVASAFGIVDGNGYPLATRVLESVAEMIESLGGGDDRALEFMKAYAAYNSSKNTPLGDACALDDELSKL